MDFPDDDLIRNLIAMNGLVPYSHVTIHNQGGYVARCSVDYDLGGQRQSNSSGNFPIAQSYSVRIPPTATNIHVTCEDATGLVRDPWKTILDETYPWPVNKTFTVTGTTLNPDFQEG